MKKILFLVFMVTVSLAKAEVFQSVEYKIDSKSMVTINWVSGVKLTTRHFQPLVWIEYATTQSGLDKQHPKQYGGGYHLSPVVISVGPFFAEKIFYVRIHMSGSEGEFVSEDFYVAP